MNKAVNNCESLLKIHKEIQSDTKIVLRMIVMDVNREEAEQFKDFWEIKGASVELRQFFPWNKSDMRTLGSIQNYPPFMPCPFSWQYVVVQWNGDVVPCCRDYNGELKLGNVKDASLKEIWNGPAYAEFRRKMTTGEGLSELCLECLKIYYSISRK